MRPPKTHWFARDCGTLVTFVFTVPCINFCKYILYILRHRYRTNGTKQQTCLKISKQLWRRLVGQQLWLVQFSVPGAHLSVCFDYLPWPHLTSPSHGLLQDTGICKVPPLQTQVYAKCRLYRHRYMQSATFTDTKTVTTVHRHTPVQQPSFQMNLGWPVSSQFSDTSCPTMSFKDRWSDGGKGREVKRKYIPREVTVSIAAPSIWNSLPDNIHLCHSLFTFKQHLKTHLFSSS